MAHSKRQNEWRNTKGLLSTSIASSTITAAKRLLEEMKAMDAQLNLCNYSLSGLLDLYASNNICLLIPHPKHCGDLAWCTLTLLPKGHRPSATRLIVTGKLHYTDVNLQAVTILKLFHHSTLFIYYYTLHYQGIS